MDAGPSDGAARVNAWLSGEVSAVAIGIVSGTAYARRPRDGQPRVEPLAPGGVVESALGVVRRLCYEFSRSHYSSISRLIAFTTSA